MCMCLHACINVCVCVCVCLPVTSRRDEVEAAVNPGIWDHLLPINAHLFVQVLVELLVDILQNRQPARKIGCR